EYEEKIRQLGGIGFFLGGIGPDGHIGFNVQGSDHFSTTRLTPTNYETQAASAGDLGGVEVSCKRLVITIGLGTITYNNNCTAITMAAGEAKSKVVAGAIQQEKNVLYPATALQKLPNARFYLTRGAAKRLNERQNLLLKKQGKINETQIEKIVIDIAHEKGKKIENLDENDFNSFPEGMLVLKQMGGNYKNVCKQVKNNIIIRIERGAQSLEDKNFLHTEPHHDDLMLGCLPFIVRNTRTFKNTHHFVTLTSGFTSVTNQYMLEQISNLQAILEIGKFQPMLEEGYFDPDNLNGRKRDVWQYLDGVAADSITKMNSGFARRFLRNLFKVYDEFDVGNIKDRLPELTHYFKTQYPGKRDPEYIQKLK
ncbi:MAG: glucosamine-6-phosphate deaminase, partial [Calditrichia bacterium]|nr:glucosamine-6-phosphate deaminase [Calditrichia bacterium]